MLSFFSVLNFLLMPLVDVIKAHVVWQNHN